MNTFVKGAGQPAGGIFQCRIAMAIVCNVEPQISPYQSLSGNARCVAWGERSFIFSNHEHSSGLDWGDKKSICNKFQQASSVTSLCWPNGKWTVSQPLRQFKLVYGEIRHAFRRVLGKGVQQFDSKPGEFFFLCTTVRKGPASPKVVGSLGSLPSCGENLPLAGACSFQQALAIGAM